MQGTGKKKGCFVLWIFADLNIWSFGQISEQKQRSDSPQHCLFQRVSHLGNTRWVGVKAPDMLEYARWHEFPSRKHFL